MAKRKAATKMKIRKVVVRVTTAVNGVLKTYEREWSNGPMGVGTLFNVGQQWAVVGSIQSGLRGRQIVFATIENENGVDFSNWNREIPNARDTSAYISGLAALMMKKMEWKAIEQVKRCQDASNNAERSSRDAQAARDAVEFIAGRLGTMAKPENPKKFVTLRVPAEMVESED